MVMTKSGGRTAHTASKAQKSLQDVADVALPASVVRGGSMLTSPPLAATPDAPEGKSYADLENISKAALFRLDISMLPKELPDFEAPGATKDTLIATWLKTWISNGLAKGELTENHLLPRKNEIAQVLGVSIGTVQNAIRYIEDEGYVESKQRIGTLLRNVSQNGQRMRKQTSKRDQAVCAIKQYILDNPLQPGETLPSAREIAKAIHSAPNTTRLALEFLSSIGILKSLGNRGNKANWALRTIPEGEMGLVHAIESETLIDQLERDLKLLIAQRYSVNDKLPSHLDLSAQFKVSIKTVHDAMRRLAEQGILHSKRGRYGTYLLRKPDADKLAPIDTSIFMPAEEISFYNYQKVERHLKALLRSSYKVGDKLPPMGVLSRELDVSSNTVRKALQNLSREKLVSFARGRYGGTYVTAMPGEEEEMTTQAFTWVSINPDTVKTYRTQNN
jgi:DNA-binding GntR family transcriptional regulator